MNQIASPGMILPIDRNRIRVAADVTNANEFEGDLEKYEHLEQLTELFFAAKRHYFNPSAPAQS
jgi:hypothetical protein